MNEERKHNSNNPIRLSDKSRGQLHGDYHGPLVRIAGVLCFSRRGSFPFFLLKSSRAVRTNRRRRTERITFYVYLPGASWRLISNSRQNNRVVFTIGLSLHTQCRWIAASSFVFCPCMRDKVLQFVLHCRCVSRHFQNHTSQSSPCLMTRIASSHASNENAGVITGVGSNCPLRRSASLRPRCRNIDAPPSRKIVSP